MIGYFVSWVLSSFPEVYFRSEIQSRGNVVSRTIHTPSDSFQFQNSKTDLVEYVYRQAAIIRS